MTDSQDKVYVVDDDASVRHALVSLLRSVDIAVEAFESAGAFLGRVPPAGPSCLVLDMRLQGTSGAELQAELNSRGVEIPIIFITGHGTIPMTVRAMKAGAAEFLTKPFTEEDLLDAIRQALQKDQSALLARGEFQALRDRYGLLTPREREVLALVAAGRLNKQVAADLHVSEITVKVHRRRIMEKLAVQTLADLVLAAERLGVRAQTSKPYTKV